MGEEGKGVGIEEHVSFAGIIQKNQVQPFDLRTHVSWLQAISQAQWLEVDSLRQRQLRTPVHAQQTCVW